MKEQNPLMLALNDIDTRYIIRPKRKKKAIALTAIFAAASLSLLTGFTVYVFTEENRGVYIDDDKQFNYELTDRKDLSILPEEELLKMGAVECGNLEQGSYSFCFKNVLPGDILRLYNADPVTLGNDKFTEILSDVYVYGSLEGKDGGLKNLDLGFELIHKGTGEKISLTCCYSIDNYQIVSSRNIDTNTQKYDKEVIDLNDGSKCLITEVRNKGYERVYSHADFSYKGTIYGIDTIKSGRVDMDAMKRILSDLGVV